MDKLRRIWIPAISLGLLVILVILLRKGITSESNKWYGVLYASDYFPPLNAFPNTADADERLLIYQRLGEAYQFGKSSRYENEKNYYCAAGSEHSVVTVYEVTDPIEQQKIVQAAKRIRNTYGTRSFSIEFYAKQVGPSPRDQFLRKVRID